MFRNLTFAALLAAAISLLPDAAHAQRIFKTQTVSAQSIAELKTISTAASFIEDDAHAIISDRLRMGMFIHVSDDMTAIAAADTLEGIFIDYDANPLNGGWVRKEFYEDAKVLRFEWFGADNTLNPAAGTPNRTALQGTINFLEASVSTSPGGHIEPRGQYYVNGSLDIGLNGAEGVTISGLGLIEKWFIPTGLNDEDAPASFIFQHTNDVGIRVWTSSHTLRNFRIDADATRQAAAASVNLTGLLVMDADDTDTNKRVNYVTVENVASVNQPGWGMLLQHDSLGAKFNDNVTSNNKMGGIGADAGDIFGRTNIDSRPGEFEIVGHRSYDNGGHCCAVGHPNNGNNIPYRAKWEGGDNGQAAQDIAGAHDPRWADTNAYFRMENSEVVRSAFAGSTRGGAPFIENEADCVHLSGPSNRFLNNRMISCATPLLISEVGALAGQTADDIDGVDTGAGGQETIGVKVEGFYVAPGASVRPHAIAIEEGVEYVFLKPLNEEGYTNLISGSGYDCVTINDSSGTSILNCSSGEVLYLQANDINENGQMRMLQNGTGDVGMRLQISDGGLVSWSFGAENTSDDFVIDAATNLNSTTPDFLIEDITGNIGIGTNAPSRKLDIAGDVNFGGKVGFGDDDELTIAAGVVTATKGRHRIDTEADASTDDLDTINGAIEGDWIILKSTNSARDVVVKDGTGNIALPGASVDITLDSSTDRLILEYDGASWVYIAFADNG